MRLLLSCILLMCITQQTMAQVKIGDNPGTINGASLLELESKSGTFVLPRMSTSDRDALSNHLPGSQIYNTTKQCIDLYDGSIWDCLVNQNNQSDNQQVTIQGDSLIIQRGGAVDLSLFLDNTDNQQISSFTYNALTFELAITLESGGTEFVDLSSLNDAGTDDQNLGAATLTGTDLVINIEDGAATTADLSALEESADIAAVATDLAAHITADEDTDNMNEVISSGSLSGTDLQIVDAGGTTTIDLSSLNDAGTDDQNLGAATLTGTDLVINIEDGAATTADLSALEESADIAAVASDLADHETADGDLSATNELITTAVLSGTDLEITDAGGTKTVDLSSLNDAGTDDQNLGAATLTGTDLVINIEDGAATTADLSALEESADIAAVASDLADHETADGDLSATNELITTAVLSGTDLEITDAGGTKTVDLSSLNDAGTDDQNLGAATLTGTDLVINIEDGAATTADLSALEESADIAAVASDLADHESADGDLSATNELVTTAVLSGTDLEITDAGGTKTVDLSSLNDAGTDDQNLGAATLTGTDLVINIEDGAATTADLSALEESADIAAVASDLADHESADGDLSATNELITTAVLSGTDLEITDAGGTKTVDLSSLNDAGTDDQNLGAATLTGTDLVINIEDGAATTADLSALEESADIAAVASDLADHESADGDLSATNELVTTAVLSGTDLEITDAGGTKTVDLSSLNDAGTDDQNLGAATLTGTDLVINIEDGAATTADLSALEESADIAAVATDLAAHITADEDTDNMNEVISSGTLSGTDLQIVDAGGTTTIDLSSLNDAGTDDQNLGAATLTGTDLVINIEDGAATTADLSALEESADIAAVATDLAAHITADEDTDNMNEVISSGTLSGTDLQIVDPGGTTTIDLSSLNDAGTDDQNLGAATLTGTDLVINIEDGAATTADLSALEESADIAAVATDLAAHITADEDTDNMNEVISSGSLSGTDLQIVDAGGTTTIDLSSLNDAGTDDQNLGAATLTGTDLVINIEDGAATTADLSALEESADIAAVATDLAAHITADEDTDNMNEVISSGTLSGTDLQIVDAGGTTTIDLSSLNDAGTDDQNLGAATLTGTDLVINIEDGAATTADLSALEESADIAAVATDLAAHITADEDTDNMNEVISSGTLSGTDLQIVDAGGTTTIDLSSLNDAGTDDQNLGAATLTGTDLVINIEDGAATTADLSALEESADIAAVATDLAAHITADEDTDNMNEVISSGTLSGTDLQIVDAGGTTTIDLSSLNDAGTDDQNLGAATLTGTDLVINIEDGAATTADLSALEESADIAAVASDLADHETADGDLSATNELITTAVLSGTDLEITDAGGTKTVDLSSLNDAGTDDQNLGAATLTGTDLVINIEDGAATTADLSALEESADIAAVANDLADHETADGDLSATNELITTAVLSGTDLEITDAGGTKTVDLSSLNDAGTDDQNLGAATLTGTDLVINIEDGAATTADLSALEESADIAAVATDLADHESADGDLSATNELITTAVLSGTDLEITDAGGTKTVDLSSLNDAGTDDQNLGTATLTGTDLVINIENGTATTADLSALEESADIAAVATDLAAHITADEDTDNMNEVISSGSLSGTDLQIVDAGGTTTIDLSSLNDAGTDDQNLGAATLTGTDLVINIEDGAATTADLSALEESADIAAVASDLADHETADGDLSATNELITTAVLSGTDLEITDAGGTKTVDLSSLNDAGTDDQNLGAATLTGTDLVINIEDGAATTADLSALEESAHIAAVASDLADHETADGDLSVTNELITTAVLSGTDLEITDAGGTKTVDLSSLNDAGTDDQNLGTATLTGTDLVINIEDGAATTADLSALEESADIAAVATDLAAHITADEDTDNMNEVISSGTLSGTDLQIVDAGGTTTIDLSSLNDAGTDDQNLGAATLTGTDLVINIEDGAATTADLSALEESADIAAVATDLAAHITADEDTDNMNEVISSGTLSGTDLQIVDAGGTTTIDLSSLNDAGTDDQNLGAATLTGTDLVINIEDGAATTADLSVLEESADIAAVASDLADHESADGDLSATNELVTTAVLSGTDLEITDAGGTKTVDLSSLNDAGTDDQNLGAATLTGTDLVINIEDGAATTADLSALEESADIAAVASDLADHESADGDLSATNELITTAVLSGTDLEITDAGGTKTIDLSSLNNAGTDDQNLGAATLTGTDLVINIEDGAATTADLSALEESADIAAVATDLAAHITADEDTDNMNEVISSGSLSGTDLQIVDAGGTTTIDLSSLNDAGTDDQNLGAATLTGTDLVINIEDGAATTADLSALEESADIAAVASDLADHETADGDLSATNELITTAVLSGTDLEITDAGGTKTVDLSSLNDAGTDDQNLGAATLTGTDLVINIEDGAATTADLSALEESADIAAVASDLADHETADGDLSPTNELLTTAVLTGTDLEITDAGGTKTVDLSALNDAGTDDQDLGTATLTGTDLVINIEDGAATTADLSALEESADIAAVASDLADHETADGDLSATNELITTAVLTGTDLEITDAGGTKTVDLSSLNDAGTDDQNLGTATLTGTDLVINIEDGAATTADLSALEESADITAVASDLADHESADGDLSATNELITTAVLSGTDLEITDAGGTKTVDLSSLNDTGTDDQNLGTATLTGTDLVINIENGTATTADLSALEESADIAAVATDLAAHITADEDTDNMNEVISSGTLSGTDLQIVDAGGTTTIDLSSLNDAGTDDQNLGAATLTGTDLVINIEDGTATTADLSALEESADIAAVATDLAAHITADEDTDNMNEVISSGSLSGTDLQIVDAGGTTTIDLSSLNDAGTDDQNLGAATLTGTDLVINIEDGAATTADLSALEESADIAAVATDLAAHITADEDTDNMNEVISSGSLSGTDLQIVDAGGTTTIDLSSLNDAGTDDQNLGAATLTGTDLVINIEDGTATTADLSALEESADIAAVATDLAAHITADEDTDNMNEVISSGSLSGTDLQIVDAGGTTTIDLSSLNDAGTDDQNLGAATLTGTDLVINIEDGAATTADLSALEESADIAAVATDLADHESADGDLSATNELITTAVLSGTDLEITDAGGTKTVDLSSLNDAGTDDQNLGAATLTGTDLVINIEDGAATTADLSALEESADIAAVASDLADHETADGDLSATNELITTAVLSGTDLEITDAGGTKTVDLSSLNDAGTDDQNLGTATLTGTDLVINIENGAATTADLSALEESADIAAVATDLAAHITADEDTDNMNEVISSGSLSGTDLQIVDAGGTTTIDLSSLNDAGTDDQNLGAATLTGTDLVINIENGTATTADLSALEESADIAAVASDLADHETADGDLSATNELITTAVLSGTDLEITDAGGTKTVDLSSLNDAGTDDQNLGAATLTGTDLVINIEDGAATTADLSALEESADIAAVASDLADHETADGDLSATNELITTAVLSGTDLEITDAGGTKTVDLSSLNDAGTDDQNLGTATLTGTDLVINIEDGAATTADLSDLEESADIAAVASDLADHETADGDLSATNELITTAVLTGTDLEITDAGGTKTVDLSSLNDAGTDDQDLGTAILTGTDLTINIEDGTATTADLSDLEESAAIAAVASDLADHETADGDLSATNELISTAVLTGTDLEITDAGGTKTVDLSSLNDAGTDDQNLGAATLTGTDLVINIENGTATTADLSALESTVTQVVTTGHTIATHTSGTSTTNIIETNTSIAQDDTNPTGEITFTNESGLESTAQVVAAEATNEITVGANGGSYFRSPIRAMGKINADGTSNNAPLNATVTKTGTGVYLVTLDPAAGITDADYVIQLTVRDSEGAGNDDYDVSYRAQMTSTFIVEIGDNDNGGSNRANADFEFMFTVLTY